MSFDLAALVRDQRARASDVRSLIGVVPTDPELDEQRERLAEEIKRGEDELGEALARLDADDESEALLKLRNADDAIWRAERRSVALGRYSDEDRLLTRATHQLCEECGWSFARPLVCCTADAGFRTWGDSDLIFVTPVEHLRVLAWPDICHEMGHALARFEAVDLLGEFTSDTVYSYVAELGSTMPGAIRALPNPDERWQELIEWISSSWLDWSEEFACDAVGTYFCGPAFARQHLRLAQLNSRSVFDPTMPDTAAHPPDAARTLVIEAVLTKLGRPEPGARLREDFDLLAAIASDRVNAIEYEATFAPDLVDALAQQVIDACEGARLVSFVDAPDDGIVAKLNESWERFEDDAAAFEKYEEQLLTELRHAAGLAA